MAQSTVTLGVVVKLEGNAAVEVQALRRALRDPGLAQIDPHITLVPPVQLRPPAVAQAQAILVEAAAAAAPFTVGLGAPSTFWPVSATVHLPVEDPDGRLGALREQVFRPPLQRNTHPFVPHATLLALAEQPTIEAACRLLAGFRTSFPVLRLSLLQLHHEPRRWEVAFDVDLDGVRVLGGGPLALQLTSGTVAEPAALALLAEAELQPPGGADAVVVTARREGEVVGVGWGQASANLAAVVVDRAARGQGIGSHLRREWAFRADRRTAG